MVTIDYSKLQQQTLGSGQDEEAVTVNTRALIDKVLARYSGEWTTLRELIQNAADASASRVKIQFETHPSSTVPIPQNTDPSSQLKHVILHHTLRRLLVSNDGAPFQDSDWSRLKRIAEGNPDETKIGAFGVGFYSVFAECETPFISSGSETMAFYWKGNSLFTRKGKVPLDLLNTETCFVLDYRNSTSSIPNLMSICQFLSTSLTFIGIESIELWLDDWNIFTLKKISAPSTTLILPRDIDTKTKEGMMTIKSVECQTAQLNAVWMNVVSWVPTITAIRAPTSTEESPPSLRSFFSRLAGSSQNNAAARKAAKEEEIAQRAISEDLVGISQATVFIRLNTVSIKSQVSSTFAAELERATKKPPPKQTRIAILTSSSDETTASLSTLKGTAVNKAAEIVTSILPTKSGRIFIGFPTAQTTGLLAHISVPSLIPTVERESIDLNARYVRTWNTELLSIAGIACRIAYIGEMAVLRDKLSTSMSTAKVTNHSEDQIVEVIPSMAHTLRQYTFSESTPLGKVGQIIEESFWTCTKKASIDILSSRGVLPSHDVRIASENLSFVKGIPVIPEQLLHESKLFFTKLQDFGFISEITTSDIKKELEKQALSEEQLEEFLKWAVEKTMTSQLELSVIRSLFQGTVASVKDGPAESARLLVLTEVATYINSTRIPPELPIPHHTIPFRFTKNLSQAHVKSLGWEELQIIPWLRFLVEQSATGKALPENDLTRSAAFAEQVLPVISRIWDISNSSSKGTIVDLLAERTVIPTKFGMRKPSEAYFSEVKLFDDLPTIANLKGVKEKFLKALGVRKTMDLTLIFQRLMTQADTTEEGNRKWSHVDLLRYLVSVRDDIPQEDIARLRDTALCPAEVNGDLPKAVSMRYKVSDLYEPKEALRNLGLPVLQWPGSLFNAYSSEGKFLKHLGLRGYPPVPELVDIMHNAYMCCNKSLFERALRYFIENHYQNNYAAFDMSTIQVPFLPIEGSEKKIVPPNQCFTESKAATLGYQILRQDLQPHALKFGVQADPQMADCVIRLISNPPQTRREARELFRYFAGRSHDISTTLASKLGAALIVPVFQKDATADGQSNQQVPRVRMTTPQSCFLGDGQDYSEIFDYVDFGEEANLFLLKVGCKHEPSITELTKLVVRQPGRAFQTLRVEKYMDLLRKLYVNMGNLKKDKALWREMKVAPFLLAFKERPLLPQTQKASKSGHVDETAAVDDEPEEHVKEYHLRSAEKIILVDDLISYTLFKEHLLSAPHEEALEEFYAALGTPWVSTLVDEEPKLGPRMNDQTEAKNLRELIIERAQLFLYEQLPATILHNAKWLESNLEVQLVQTLSLRRTLRDRNLSHVEKRSAALNPNIKTKAVLCITSNYDVWQVSREVVSLLIDRAKTQTVMVFETFLVTNLFKLRSRGYNVDRVLRRKAAEARIAEAERQKLQEEEANMAQKSHSHHYNSRPHAIDDGSETNSAELDHAVMPGAFHESPDRAMKPNNSLTQFQRPQKPRNFLSSITKHLGFDEQNRVQQDPQSLTSANSLGNNEQNQLQNGLSPPPYSAYDPHLPQGQGSSNIVTSPQHVHQNLLSAINASRAHNSPHLFTRPETNMVKEIASYCDTRPGQNLSLLTTSMTGMQVYLTSTTVNRSDFLNRNRTGLDSFASLLLTSGSVFPVPEYTLHIYYDDAGNTMAFNSSGSIFFNYRFFAQLHLDGMNDTKAAGQALVYWWVVLCHELAHNLVADHSSDHSYYTEQFVAMYFSSVMTKMADMTGGAADSGGVTRASRTLLPQLGPFA